MTPHYDVAKAQRALGRADPALAQLIKQVGPCGLSPFARVNPFKALLRAIVYQQLSGKAAATIHARVLALYPRPEGITPGALLATSDDTLRAAGLSRNKILAVKDLALKISDGTVPNSRRLKTMDDETIIEQVAAVRGIGRWTVEMMLMFHLGRSDVLPVADLGVRKGFTLIYGLHALADEPHLRQHAERWRPYRSVASWYLWRALDLDQLPG